jgi:hypothetical protein
VFPRISHEMCLGTGPTESGETEIWKVRHEFTGLYTVLSMLSLVFMYRIHRLENQTVGRSELVTIQVGFRRKIQLRIS